MVVTTNGVILKKRNIGEQDAIITVLTDEFGLIEASARGVKRVKSRLSAAVQPFTYCELALFHSKERYIIDHASATEAFYNLRFDVIKVALADYLCELVCFLAPSMEHVPVVKRLLLNTFYLLSGDKKQPDFLKAVAELRLMALSGFMPDLVCCHGCSAFENVPLYLDLYQGYLLCENCRKEGFGDSLIGISASVLAAMRHIIYSEDEKLFNFTVSNESLNLLVQVTEQYVLSHAERSFRPLEIYHSLLSEEQKLL